MNEESYRLLVRSCGWTDEQYEQWLAQTITRLLDTDTRAAVVPALDKQLKEVTP